ncbi:unnamed protein product [Rhizophagus irregularis]|nr:unnamed protein product [Rhizophagus irregularis]CAB4412320.1 unnamed protein product [Rhizophagus irregularis]
MRGLFDNPDKCIVQWPNTALNESKTRKFEGRTKQPDFTVSIICQLQTSATLFVGEVSPPSKKGDVYKNCNDLIRLGVFMKDPKSSVDKGADIKVLGFQCIDYKVDYYIMDLVKGIYILLHRIQDIFRESYENFYPKLCNPKKNTLYTPKFRELVSKTHNVKRSCPFCCVLA